MNPSLAMKIKLFMRKIVIQWNRSQQLQNRVLFTPVLTCHMTLMVSFSGAFLNSHSLAWKFVPKTFFYNNMEFWNSHLPSINSLHCHHCRLFVVDREWDLIGHWLSRNGSLIGAGIQGRGKYEHEQTTFTTFCSKKNVDWFPLKCHHTISCGCLDKEEKKWYFI